MRSRGHEGGEGGLGPVVARVGVVVVLAGVVDVVVREEEEERHLGIGGAVRSDELRGALREHNLVVPAPGAERGGGGGEERRREVTGPRTDAVN